MSVSAEPIWSIQLFGSLRATCGEVEITRFRTQKTAALLAYLAFYPGRTCPREELIELLWPDSVPETGRHNLRMALSFLRAVLEPPTIAANTVLHADRIAIRLLPERLTTDTHTFETTWQQVTNTVALPDKIVALSQMAVLYQGSLLSGHYESWIVPQALRLEEVYFQALHELIACLVQCNQIERAIEYAHQGLIHDPLREYLHVALMRMQAFLGRPILVQQQYADYARLLGEREGGTLSSKIRHLAETLASEPERGALPDKKLSDALLHVPHTEVLPLEQPNTNFPLTWTRFFGREPELARLSELLRGCRLLTLTGMGGSGKTRLAIALGQQARERFDNHIWFVPLASVEHAEMVPDAIRDALGLNRAPQRSAYDQIIERLTGQDTLLILDNLEHLAEHITPLVERLLVSLPGLICVTTSRQALEMEMETLFPVAPLLVPAPDTPLERLTDYASVRLYIDRAQRVRPGFNLTRTNGRAVAELCARLDGLPLSVELAASHAAHYSPAQMLAQLSERFVFLACDRRGFSERHRSLRAVLDWSFCQLSPKLQAFFACLSVFHGSFSHAAAATLAGELYDPQESVSALQRLIECSLLLTEEHGETLRFRLLETLREYAAGKLSMEERVLLSHRHTTCFLTLAEQLEPLHDGEKVLSTFEQLDAERDNMNATLTWAQTHSPELGLRLCIALWRYWAIRGNAQEGKRHFRRSLQACPQASASLRCQALIRYSWLCFESSDVNHLDAAEEAQRLASELADSALSAEVLANRAIYYFAAGDYAVTAQLAEEAFVHAQRAERHDLMGVALHHRAAAANLLGQLNMAADYCRRSITHLRESGEHWPLAYSLVLLAFIETDRGAYAVGKRVCEEGLALHRALNCRRGIAYALRGMGGFAWYAGDYAQAEAFHNESRELFREIGDLTNAARQENFLGWAAIGQGRLDEALERFAECYVCSTQLGSRYGKAQAEEGLGHVAFGQGRISEARRHLVQALQGYEALKASVSSLIVLDLLAYLVIPEAPERAVRVLGGVVAWRQKLNAPRIALEENRYNAYAPGLHECLGQEAFQTHLAAGGQLDWGTLIQEALV